MADENTPAQEPAPVDPAPEPAPAPVVEPAPSPAPAPIPVDPPVEPAPVPAPEPGPVQAPIPAPAPAPVETPPGEHVIVAQDGAVVPPPVQLQIDPLASMRQVPTIGFQPVPVTVTYTERIRGCCFTANNALNVPPFVVLGYEKVIEGSDDSVATSRVPDLTMQFHPDRLIYMRNPATGEVIPGLTMTWGQVYAALYSLMTDEHLRRIDDPSMADKPAFPPTE